MNAAIDRPAVMPIREPRYGASVICRAAGIDAKTLNNWFSRQPAVIFLTNEERREAGERKRFAFNRDRVMQIAMTAELVRLGLPPRRAAIGAAAFTDVGEGPILHEGREPGELFTGAHTFLVVPPDPIFPRVVRVEPRTSVVELMFDQRRYAAAVVLRCDDVVHRVDAFLAEVEVAGAR